MANSHESLKFTKSTQHVLDNKSPIVSMGRNECLFAINDLVELFSGNKDKFHSEGKLEELYTHDSRGALLMSR